jgi:acyl-CoA thioester hydrolase
MVKKQTEARPYDAYKHYSPIQTRWMDNDVYGHVNNVVYYSYFDTLVNEYLIASGVLDIHEGGTIGLVVETSCNYFAPIEFPQKIKGAIGVSKIGTSSVRYEIGLFDESGECVAEGHFVHVYVDRKSRRPKELPSVFIKSLNEIKLAEIK